MNETWWDAASVLESRFVADWRAAGRKVVGYSCAYVPVEVLEAAGLLAYRLRGSGADGATIGDTYFGPFVCSLPKCMLELAGEGRYRFLDGAIITPGCDSMRRLDECWRHAGRDHPGILPGFFFHFGVPHKLTGYTEDWFAAELQRLIAALEAHFGVSVTTERLREAIRVHNRSRSLLERLDDLRARPEPSLTGAEALAVTLACGAVAREAHNDKLAAFLDAAAAAPPGAGRRRARLLLAGSASDDLELMRAVEGERAVVVADTLCFGARAQLGAVAEEGDPIRALARRYLGKNECPRMYGGYPARLEQVRRQVQRARVEGVILQSIRFCDLHAAENGLLEHDLERDGVPCLRLEREHGPLVDKGRLKLRLDAFLERIARSRGAGA